MADPEQGHAICMIQSEQVFQCFVQVFGTQSEIVQHVRLVINSYQMFHDKCYQQNHDYESLGVSLSNR